MIIITAKIDNSIEVNSKILRSLNFSKFDRSEVDAPSWGIASFGGNISFVDNEGKIKEMANNYQLKKDMPIAFDIKNTLFNTIKPIKGYYTDTWDYDNSNRIVSISFNDGLTKLQDIKISQKVYDFLQEPNTTTYKEAYISLYEKTPKRFDFLEYDDLDDETKDILERRKIYYNVTVENNLWRAWDSFAKASLCHILKNDLGQTVLRYNGGN